MTTEQAVALTIAVLQRKEDIFDLYNSSLMSKPPTEIAERIRQFVEELTSDDKGAA